MKWHKPKNRMATRVEPGLLSQLREEAQAAHAWAAATAARYENLVCMDREDWTEDDRAFMEEMRGLGIWPTN